MKKKLFQYSINSLTFKLFLLLLLAVLPASGLLLYNVHLSRGTLVDQVVSAHQNALETYALQIETQLDSASLYLTRQSFYDSDVQIVSKSDNETDIQYAYQRILDSQNSHLTSTDYLDGIFTFIGQQDGNISLLSSTNYKHTSLSQKSLTRFLKETFMNDTAENLDSVLSAHDLTTPLQSSWDLVSIDGTDYLFYLTGSAEDHIFAGAYVRVAQLLSSFEQGDETDTGTALMLFPASERLAVEQSLPQEQLLTAATLKDSLCLAETFSRSSITASLPTLPRYSSLELFSALLLLIFAVWQLNRLVLLPILRLAEAMHKIELGEVDTRMKEHASSSEIRLLHHSLNRMLDQLQALTANIIQEQMKNQKAQLRNLQLQIKPHFLINSLNMVYNLIETDQPVTARRLIQYTIDYFRYMTRVDEDLVPLNEEIDHIRAYLEIQQLRYKDMFSYDLTVDRMVDDMLIPPMTVQNFVENSIKYALNTTAGTDAEKMCIRITVTSFERDDYPYATICVQDNGAGYPEELLDSLNANKHIHKTDGTHLGLYNTIQRLSILFGEKASWQFSNAQGAVTSVTLPVTFAEEEDDG